MSVVLVVGILAVFVFGILHMRKTMRSGCCGGSDSVKAIKVSDRNLDHYPSTVNLTLEDLHCSNCSIRVENALNSLDGVYAKVSGDRKSVQVHMKTQLPLDTLTQTVRKAGYRAYAMKSE